MFMYIAHFFLIALSSSVYSSRSGPSCFSVCVKANSVEKRENVKSYINSIATDICIPT